MIMQVVLVAVLALSVLTDLRGRTILNAVTYPAMMFGVMYHVWLGGWRGLALSSEGLLLGLGLLLTPFLLGGMGAGDVKLLAAIGSLIGSSAVFDAFIYTCLIGGVMASIIVTMRNEWRSVGVRMFYVLTMRGSMESLRVLDHREYHKGLPYAVPIALGTAVAVLAGGSL